MLFRSHCAMIRARVHGTYDAMQFKRVQYDRQIFLQHALSMWRIWRHPGDFLTAYRGTLEYFYWYFHSVSIESFREERYIQSITAGVSTFYVFPARALFHVFSRKDFRSSLVRSLFAMLHRRTAAHEPSPTPSPSRCDTTGSE